MRHRRRQSAIALAAIAWPTLLFAQATAPADAAKVSAWATGGATANGKPAAAGLSYWQAPALPAAVVQGGTIPPGWQPQPIPYQGVGPDGRVITQYFAPTYTFTYQSGPPVLAVPQPSAVNRRQVPVYRSPQAYGAAPSPYAPAVPYPVPPPAAGVPPSTVTRYAAPPAPPPAPAGWGPSAMPPPAPTVAAPPPTAGWAAAVPVAAAATAAAPPPTAALAPVPAPADASPVMQPVVGPSAQTAAGMQTVARPSLWRVVGVQDGDTVSCLDDLNQQRKVGLADIDAPEIGQDYGKQSREALAGMVFGRTVEVSNVALDASGTPTARLFAGGVDVSRQMVATGNAWQDPASQDRSLATEQSQARAAQLGLWASPSPTPPWTYRGTAGQ